MPLIPANLPGSWRMRYQAELRKTTVLAFLDSEMLSSLWPIQERLLHDNTGWAERTPRSAVYLTIGRSVISASLPSFHPVMDPLPFAGLDSEYLTAESLYGPPSFGRGAWQLPSFRHAGGLIHPVGRACSQHPQEHLSPQTAHWIWSFFAVHLAEGPKTCSMQRWPKASPQRTRRCHARSHRSSSPSWLIPPLHDLQGL